MPEIFIGSDHRGFEKKQRLVAKLSGAVSLNDQIVAKDPDTGEDYQVTDCGPASYDPDDDYNDIARRVAEAVRTRRDSRGILLCGSAHGIAIQANRYKGVRAIEAMTEESAKIGREHNDANILCLSADNLSDNEIDKIASIFLNTKASAEERHRRRIIKLDEIGED